MDIVTLSEVSIAGINLLAAVQIVLLIVVTGVCGVVLYAAHRAEQRFLQMVRQPPIIDTNAHHPQPGLSEGWFAEQNAEHASLSLSQTHGQ